MAGDPTHRDESGVTDTSRLSDPEGISNYTCPPRNPGASFLEKAAETLGDPSA